MKRISRFKRTLLIASAMVVLSTTLLYSSTPLSDLPKIPADLEEAGKLHGHICFGLTKGYLAVKIAQKELQGEGFAGSPILPVSENKQCGVDAIQAVLKENSPFGNSLGNKHKGLVIENIGKDVWKFVRLKDMKGIRVARKVGAFKSIFANQPKEYKLLKRKFFANIANAKEKHDYLVIERKNIQKMLALPFEQTYAVRALTLEETSRIQHKYLSHKGPPNKTRHVCSICGEEFLEKWGRIVGGKMVCIPCAEKSEKKGRGHKI